MTLGNLSRLAEIGLELGESCVEVDGEGGKSHRMSLLRGFIAVSKMVSHRRQALGKPGRIICIKQQAHGWKGGPVEPAHEIPCAHGDLILAGDTRKRHSLKPLAVAGVEEGG